MLLSANCVCACETAVLVNGFSNPFMGFQKKKRKRKERKSPKTSDAAIFIASLTPQIVQVDSKNLFSLQV